MSKADSQPGLTAESIQEKINEKLSAKQTFFHTEIKAKLGSKLNEKNHQLQAKVYEKLHDRICCRMCAVILFVGIVAASTTLVTLISAKLTPRPTRPGCGTMRCMLQSSATWAKFTTEQLKYLGAANNDEVLTALSTAWLEHHAEEFADAHHSKHNVRRLQDAHEKMSGEMEGLANQYQETLAMSDGTKKAESLQDIVAKSDAIDSMAGEVAEGKSFHEVRLKTMTSKDAYQVRACADMLRTVGVEACGEDPGTTTGLLRSLGIGAVPEKSHPASSIWPVNLQYPGVRALNAQHGIYVVDDFLSPDECAAMIKNSSAKHVQNRSSVSHGSFVSLHSRSSPTHKAHSKERSHVPKWMYTGMPGALIELDMKGQKEQAICKPEGMEQMSDAWLETVGPLFQERGQDLQKCEKSGFGDTRFFDVSCPLDTGAMDQVAAKIGQLTHASPSQLQPMKLLHYGRGDFDVDHYNTDSHNSNGKVAPLLSVVVSLSSVKGGATYFPDLNLRVEQVPGQALIFPALTMNLNAAAGSLHAEEEVKKGDKWVLDTSVLLGHREYGANPCTAK